MREGWRESTFAEIAAERGLAGGPFGSNLGRKDYVPSGIPVLRGQNLSTGRFVDYSDCVFVTNEKLRSTLVRNTAEPGDVVFTQRGTLGQVAVVPQGPFEIAVISQSQMRLRVSLTVADPWFVFYFSTSPAFLEQLGNRAIVTGVPHINLGILSNMRVPLPPLAEQRRIAGVLGALDDLIDTNQRLVAELTDLVSCAYEAAQLHLDGTTKPIGEAVNVVGGSTPKTGNPEYWNGPHAWATPKDLSRLTSIPLCSTERSITQAGVEQISSGVLPAGTLLMSSRAPVGYLAIAEVPVAVNQGFIALKCSEDLPNLWVWQWLAHNMNKVLNRANGSTFQEISKSNFRPIGIDILDEETLKCFMAVAAPAYSTIVGLEAESDQLRATRDELLPLLMSGAVSPGDVAVAS